MHPAHRLCFRPLCFCDPSARPDDVKWTGALQVCADTIVGNQMIRGISGGQRKRVTTGEMTVGPMKTLFMVRTDPCTIHAVFAMRFHKLSGLLDCIELL